MRVKHIDVFLKFFCYCKIYLFTVKLNHRHFNLFNICTKENISQILPIYTYITYKIRKK